MSSKRTKATKKKIKKNFNAKLIFISILQIRLEIKSFSEQILIIFNILKCDISNM